MTKLLMVFSILGGISGITAFAEPKARGDSEMSDFAVGKWDLELTTTYSTCPKVHLGDVQTVTWQISVASGGLVAKSSSGNEWIGSTKGSHPSSLLFLRKSSAPGDSGVELWPSDDMHVAGRQVTAIFNPLKGDGGVPLCAFVNEVRGKRGR